MINFKSKMTRQFSYHSFFTCLDYFLLSTNDLRQFDVRDIMLHTRTPQRQNLNNSKHLSFYCFRF